MLARTPMLARDALVSDPLAVAPATTLFELIDAVLASNQTTAAVVEHGRLIGVVSSVDVLRHLLPAYLAMDEKLAHVLHDEFFEEALDRLGDVLVADVMVTDVVTIAPDASVMHAVSMFVRHHRKTLPVVDGDRFLGSVTRRSVLRLIRSKSGQG